MSELIYSRLSTIGIYPANRDGSTFLTPLARPCSIIVSRRWESVGHDILRPIRCVVTIQDPQPIEAVVLAQLRVSLPSGEACPIAECAFPDHVTES